MSSSPQKNMAAKVSSKYPWYNTPSRFSVWIPKFIPYNFNDVLPWNIVATWVEGKLEFMFNARINFRRSSIITNNDSSSYKTVG